MPFGPALPNGVRTPSTKTTSLPVRGTWLSPFIVFACLRALGPGVDSRPCSVPSFLGDLRARSLSTPARPLARSHASPGGGERSRDRVSGERALAHQPCYSAVTEVHSPTRRSGTGHTEPPLPEVTPG